MKKNILNLEGVVVLTKHQQQSINGGVSGSCMGYNVMCYMDIEEDSETYMMYICEVGGVKNICYCCSMIKP